MRGAASIADNPPPMDSQITAAARALATGDVLAALDQVALRDDPSALALRGIAMARLGELSLARELLRRAARGFGPREPLARARCVVAQAEIGLAARELGETPTALVAARRTLEARGDRVNALHARGLEIRRLLLLGRVDEAATALDAIALTGAPPPLVAVVHLLRADVALRRVRCAAADAALSVATEAARRSGLAPLLAEIAAARAALERPAARRIIDGTAVPVRLAEIEALHRSNAVLVDACRRVVRRGDTTASLVRRPVLFALARALGEAWPAEVPRAVLLARAFGVTRPNDSHRARLRVELGRLRRALGELAEIRATERGYVLQTSAPRVVALAPPVLGDGGGDTDDGGGSVLALLADGCAWSSSALALALGSSQRTTQRTLVALERAGHIRAIGRARAQRWVAPPSIGFTTVLLLPAPVPVD